MRNTLFYCSNSSASKTFHVITYQMHKRHAFIACHILRRTQKIVSKSLIYDESTTNTVNNWIVFVCAVFHILHHLLAVHCASISCFYFRLHLFFTYFVKNT